MAKTDSVAVLRERIENVARDVDPNDSYDSGMNFKQIASELRAVAAALSAQGESKPTWFPLLGTPFAIRRDMLNEEQAEANHYQTLDQLARRGGLSPEEARAVVKRAEIRTNQRMRDAFAELIAAMPALHPAPPGAGDAVTEAEVDAAIRRYRELEPTDPIEPDETTRAFMRELLEAALAARTGKGEANGR